MSACIYASRNTPDAFGVLPACVSGDLSVYVDKGMVIVKLADSDGATECEISPVSVGDHIGALIDAMADVEGFRPAAVRPAGQEPALRPTAAQVQQLADAACEADMAREFTIRPEWEAAIRQAVDLLHRVAMACEREYGFQVYAHDDEVGE